MTRTIAPHRLIPLLAAALCLAATAAVAQSSLRLSDRFDSQRLTRSEARILQGALALDGAYDALLDGAWGGGSRGALQEWVRDANGGTTPTWRDVRALVRGFAAEREQGGWAPVWHADVAVWHMRPDRLLIDQSDGRERRYTSQDGGLIVISRPGFERPDDIHADFARDARRGSRPYRLDEDGRLVTAAEMRGGRFAYVRSDRARSASAAIPWITHVIIADDANRGRLQLIASSFARSRQSDLDPRGEPILGALLRDGGSLPTPTPAQPRTGRDVDPLESVLGAILSRALERSDDGDREREAAEARAIAEREAEEQRRRRANRIVTGVFVNTTDILTTDALERVCGGDVVRPGGVGVTLVAQDADRGLALYAAPERSPYWVPVALGAPRGGGDVTVVQRNPRGRLQSTQGTVDGSRGGARLRIDVDLPDRPARPVPLLDRSEALVGMASGTRDRRNRLEAVTAAELVAFLDAGNVPFGTPAGTRSAERGLDERTRRAIVALRCAPR